MNKASLTQLLREKAQDLGFDMVGFIPVSPSQSIEIYKAWLKKDYAGSMDYLKRHTVLKEDPRMLLPETQSLVILGMNYGTSESSLQTNDPANGRISRYAWGDDYHDLIREKLRELQTYFADLMDTSKSRSFVDSGPVLEREMAQRAGLGWIGKNGNVIHWKKGSLFFLAEMLVNVPLTYDLPFIRVDCGSCTRCIDACPTEAIVADRTVDARKCISYLTIELKGEIPEALRTKMGNWIFGCDVCQDVCPWNKKTPNSSQPAFQPRIESTGQALIDLMSMDQETFSKLFKKSPVKRTKRRGLLRNVAVALGNWKHPDAIPVLKAALQDDEPLIRSHSEWALKQIEG